MNSRGIVRSIDQLGRIVVPAEIRRSLKIDSNDKVEIIYENNQIVIKKFEPFCIFCASTDGLMTYKGKNICKDCIRTLENQTAK